MNVDDEIKAIKDQVSMLCNQFNEKYREFLSNEERIKSFSDVFKSLDDLNGILKELYYRSKIGKNKKKKINWVNFNFLV